MLLSIFYELFSSSHFRLLRHTFWDDCHLTSTVAVVGTRMSRTYEIVHPVTLKMARPLIIFGPLKERITEELLKSEEFATCIQRKFRTFFASN